MGNSLRVVIVGAGIIGCCIAEACARKGYSVTVLEAGSENDRGASFGNGGILVPSHFIPLASPGTLKTGLKMMLDASGPLGIKFSSGPRLWSWLFAFMKNATKENVQKGAPVLAELNKTSIDAYEALCQRMQCPEALQKKGMMMVCETQSVLDEEIEGAHMAKELGIETEVFKPEAMSEKIGVPGMKAAGGVYYPGDAHMSPDTFLPALRKYLGSLGVEMIYNAPITSMQVSSHSVTLGSMGKEWTADEVVLAAGTWTGYMAQELLNTKLPLVGGQGMHFMVKNPNLNLTVPSILVASRIAITPMDQGVRFGGTMELGLTQPRVNENKLRRMIKSVQDYMPNAGVGSDVGKVWAGLRPCLPDGIPAVGRLASNPRVTVATGHAMMGWSLGAITGELVGDLLSGENRIPPILSPSRFGV